MDEKIKYQRSQKGQNIVSFTEDQAREYFEKLRWPNGICCIKCGSVACYKLQGKSTRPGLIKCRDCKAQFTVMVDSILADSHLSLSQWAKAYHFMCASKKGVSALQMQRMLGLGSYKTAWHLCHRIRESMRSEPTAGMLKGRVEIDETYVGPKSDMPGRTAPNKKIIMALVERNGQLRAPVVPNVGGKTLKRVIRDLVDPSAIINTDGFPAYKGLDKEFAAHETVNHAAKEYARGATHVNTCESFFGLMKRGIIGSFHHISTKHASRYADEFAFRWNGRKLTDTQRRDAAVKGAEGKRLMYKSPKVKIVGPAPRDGDQLPMWDD